VRVARQWIHFETVEIVTTVVSSNAQYIWVQVPLACLGEVHQVLADAHRNWDPQELRRMVVESSESMRYILRALASAKRDDEWTPSRRLARALKHKPNAGAHTVAGVLGAFGRRVKNRHEWTEWPIELRQSAAEDGNWEYRLLPSVRRLILEFLDAIESGR
jgi:hypothetical protein